MSKQAILPIERQIVSSLRFWYNRSTTIKNLKEWSTSEKEIDKNLEPGEVKVHVPTYGVWVAVDIQSERNKREIKDINKIKLKPTDGSKSRKSETGKSN